MNVKIISIGRKRAEEYRRLEQEYLKRLSPFMKISLELLKPVKPGASDSSLYKEGQEVLKRVSESSFLCALDRKGKMLSSEEFAKFLNDLQKKSIREIVFVIGGAVGLGKNVIDRADYLLSLSPMTFPHDMVPLILFEQLYRGNSILQGSKYHK